MPIPDTLDSLTLRRDRIQQEFASLGDLRPGSLTRRLQQCGKPGCRCKAEGATGHGPYWSLTFKVQGKTVIQRPRWSARGNRSPSTSVSVPWRRSWSTSASSSARRDLPRGTTGPVTKKKKRLRDRSSPRLRPRSRRLRRGTSEALDLEAWETAARRCCPAGGGAGARGEAQRTPATTGDPGCLANAAGRRAMRDDAANASPASWVRWCWSEPTTTASGVSRASTRATGSWDWRGARCHRGRCGW